MVRSPTVAPRDNPGDADLLPAEVRQGPDRIQVRFQVAEEGALLQL